MKVLVTGCFGFIGYNFILHLENLGIDYIGIDNLTSLTSKFLYKNKKNKKNFYICDVSDINEIKQLNDEKIDTIFNFAAETHVDNSINDPSIFFMSNVNSLIDLLSFSLKKEVREVIHISTDEVYGSTKNKYFNENSIFNPSSPYSASKASAEHLCSSFQNTYGLNIKILRPANNYGIYQQPEKLIPFSIANLQIGNNIELYGDGNQVRHWLHVDDTCTGIIKVWREGLSGQAYNIGSGQYFQNFEVVNKLLNILNLKQDRLTYVKDRPGHDFKYAIDFSKINSLGWKPTKSFEDELPKIVYWYQENINFWKAQHNKILEKRNNRFHVED